MTSSKKIAALIVAGGKGERFGSAIPKQFLPLMGKTVLDWSLDAFKNHPMISDICMVAASNHLIDHSLVVSGGHTRQESVRKGLEALRALNPDIVLIHDAARPLITEKLITSICHAAVENGAAVPAIPITDALKRDGKTEKREGLYTVQTPQAFSFTTINALHAKYKDLSLPDDAALFEQENLPVATVVGDPANIKITHPEDLLQAEKYLLSCHMDARTGQGYDVHRLVPSKGKPLMLGGITIPHDKTLEGHSDADVALHALTDAILGTIGAGDIGQHFSPKDDRWKGADSTVFLKHAASLVEKEGGIITHADITIICEEPKIAPYRDAMREKISDLLKISLNRISIKATTTEGLGFTGRGEGIAAQAIVTVRV